VDAVHAGYDADPGPRQPGQVGDLATRVHAHLEHGGAVIATKAQERQRQADLVVLVALAPEGAERRAQDRRDGLLRGRLGDAPGHADDQRLEACAPARRKGAKGDHAVRHGEDGDVTQRVEHRVRDGARHDERGGPCYRGRCQEPVAVRPLSRERHEQLAWTDEP